MSEHDEPKTALTEVVAAHALILLPAPSQASARCLCGETMGERPSFYAARHWHAAHLADVLLAEGYATTPAPEATETVEWSLIDSTGHRYTGAPEGLRWTRHQAGVAASCGDRLEHRTVTTRPEVVTYTEWVPVDRAADEHEEGGQ